MLLHKASSTVLLGAGSRKKTCDLRQNGSRAAPVPQRPDNDARFSQVLGRVLAEAQSHLDAK